MGRIRQRDPSGITPICFVVRDSPLPSGGLLKYGYASRKRHMLLRSPALTIYFGYERCRDVGCTDPVLMVNATFSNSSASVRLNTKRYSACDKYVDVFCLAVAMNSGIAQRAPGGLLASHARRMSNFREVPLGRVVRILDRPEFQQMFCQVGPLPRRQTTYSCRMRISRLASLRSA